MRVVRGNQIVAVMVLALLVGLVLVASDSVLAEKTKKISSVQV